MAKIKQINKTALTLSAAITIGDPKMIPRFLKEFRHPKHLKIRTIEQFKSILLEDLISFYFDWDLMLDLDDDFMDLSQLYPTDEDSSYAKETFLVEVIGTRKYKIEIPLLGTCLIDDLKVGQA